MILVRYVLKELIGPFLAALFGITFLFVVDFLVKILDNVLSKGLPASTVLEIFALNLAWMLSLSIPMAVLVACLMAFGRMSGDQEITAVKAAGISPLSLMRPVLLVALAPLGADGAFQQLGVARGEPPFRRTDERRFAQETARVYRCGPPHYAVPRRAALGEPHRPGVGHAVRHPDFTKWKRRALRVLSMPIAQRWTTWTMVLHLCFRLRSGETHMTDPDNPENYFRIRFFSQDLGHAECG